MDNCRILITGDYWHEDFRQLVSEFCVPTTMVPLEQLSTIDGSHHSDLIILAQSRRGQISLADVQQLQKKYPLAPMVALCGSWCEGEERSGEPYPGVVRVYWHQWQGRYDQFLQSLSTGELADWQQPKTANRTDRMQSVSLPQPVDGILPTVGVSTRSRYAYEMTSDALSSSGWNAVWLEQQPNPENLSVVCVEANSVTDEIEQRIQTLKSRYPSTPLVAILNFPRPQEVANAKALGVSRVVSKPFQLADLRSAILSASGASGGSATEVA